MDQRVLEIVIRAKDEASKAMDKAAKGLSGSLGSLGSVAAMGGAAVAAAAVAGALALNKAADAAAAYGMSIVTVQRLTGGTADESSRLAAIMGRLGVTGRPLGVVFRTLATNINGNSAAMQAMGIATKDANGHNRTTTEVLKDVAQYYSTAKDKTEAVALASKVLGRGYMALLPVLSGGAEGFDKLAKKAGEAGLVLSQKQIDDVRRYAVATKDAEEAQKGLTVQFGLIAIPVKTFINEHLTKLFIWLQKLAKDPAVQAFAAWAKQSFDKAGKAFADMGAWWGRVWPQIRPVLEKLREVVGGALTQAWNNLREAWAKLEPQVRPLIPYLKIAALVIGGILVLAIVGAIIVIAKIVQGVTWFIKKLVEMQTGIIHARNVVINAFRGMADGIMSVLQPALDAISRLNPFAKHSPSLVDNVRAGVAAIAGAYGGLSGMRIAGPTFAGGGGMPAFAGGYSGSYGGGAVAGAPVQHIHLYIDGKEVSRALGVRVTHADRSGTR